LKTNGKKGNKIDKTENRRRKKTKKAEKRRNEKIDTLETCIRHSSRQEVLEVETIARQCSHNGSPKKATCEILIHKLSNQTSWGGHSGMHSQPKHNTQQVDKRHQSRYSDPAKIENVII
jgi:hypothetical protein